MKIDLPDNLKSGVEEIDEITEILHNKYTPAWTRPFFEELRDFRIQYQSNFEEPLSSSIEHKPDGI